MLPTSRFAARSATPIRMRSSHRWTPDPEHLATLAGAARRRRFITTNDGVGVFDQSFLDQLIRGGVDQEGVRRIGRDTFTFELQRLPALASATINDSKLTTCADCGRATPVFPSNREDLTIVLATRPDEVLVRSVELFGRAYLRHHELYLSDPLFSTLGLLEGYEVVTNSP